MCYVHSMLCWDHLRSIDERNDLLGVWFFFFSKLKIILLPIHCSQTSLLLSCIWTSNVSSGETVRAEFAVRLGSVFDIQVSVIKGQEFT